MASQCVRGWGVSGVPLRHVLWLGFTCAPKPLCNMNWSAAINGEDRFASKAQSWSEQKHDAGIAADYPAFCALQGKCHRAVHTLGASSWAFHHHGLRTTAKDLHCLGAAMWELGKEMSFARKTSSLEMLKMSTTTQKNITPNQPRDSLRNEFLTMPTVVSQQGPLGTSAGSRGGGVAVLPFPTDELWWPSSVQCVMFFTTSSSASCNEETHSAKNIRK